MLEARLDRVRKLASNRGLDALLVTAIPNIFYLSGFTGSTAALIVTADASHILVDPRYTTQARAECRAARVVEYSGKTLVAAAGELANEIKPNSLGLEAENLTVAGYRALRKVVDPATRLRSTKGLVESLRRVKDSAEIELIRTAAAIADAAFESALLEIEPGMTEKQVALAIDSALRRMGADKEAFETIAAAGPNAACPHAKPTDAILQTGQMLKLDFGARYAGYNSDITRTIFAGRPTAKAKRIYKIVLDAQQKAIEAIAPGKAGREIDAIARDYIAQAGFGESFGHGLGHQLGIEVHDGPGLSTTSEIVLEAGMVLTVEPGIYIEGWGGARIEDDVVVTEKGAEVITGASKAVTTV